MRRIAIIGSGVAGLLAAHGLLQSGHQVTLYSDRTGEQWLKECRPTGTAARFDLALSYDRELGLNFWDDAGIGGQGVHLTFCPQARNQLLTLLGRLERPFLAIDVRLISQRWMEEFERRGGRLVIESVSLERLDEISGEHDLTLVAAGRADLCRLFERHPARSVYAEPQRRLTLLCVVGARDNFEHLAYLPVKFNLLATDGEAFWVPYFHKDHGPSWNLLFEAKPGGAMDRFGAAKTGAEAVAIAKAVIKDLFPWDYAWVKDVELADPNGWLVGSFAPTVRHPLGRLPSGRVVGALGDTAMSFDPIGGQGANNGTKMARHLVGAVNQRGGLPFDEAWIESTFEQFYTTHGHPSYTFNNILLEPITAAGKELLIAQYGSTGALGNPDRRQAIADAFSANFSDPRELTPMMQDVGQARDFISRTTGKSWLWSALAGRLRIGKNQIRQRLRKPAYDA